MKLMFASQGNSLDSLLAPGIDKAEWYLIVDSVTGEVNSIRAIGQPLHDVLAGASTHGVNVLFMGSNAEHSQIRITSDLITVAFVQAITAGEALDRWNIGKLDPPLGLRGISHRTDVIRVLEKKQPTRRESQYGKG